MALRNLHSLVNRYTAGAVSPNFIGSWMSSAGSAELGDAAFTGAIAGAVLTVSAIASGALAIGSMIAGNLVLPATTVQAFGTGTGGLGTYTLTPAQPDPISAEAMTATGPGKRTPKFTEIAGVSLQFQALSGKELEHLDALNIQGTTRAVYMNGQAQGVQRPDVKGGDLLIAPTGLSGQASDTWLVTEVIEGWDIDGWCKVAVVLQMPSQAQ